MLRLLFGMSVCAWLCASSVLSAQEYSQIFFKDHSLQVELARTPEQRSLGLMHRKTLPENQGMLFIFPRSGYYSFWMKNVHIPLDIIWLDELGNVLHVERNVPPAKNQNIPVLKPPVKARYVLELNSGASQKLGITKGEHLQLGIQ